MKGELMMKRTIIPTIFVFIGALFLLACGQDNKPAELAVKAAETAVNTAKAEAVKYVPDQVKSLEDALAAVKEKFAKKEYKDVIPEAQALANKAKEVLDAAKLKKEEMVASWTGISEELPKMVETMQGKVDELSKAKKLPADLTSEKFVEAKAGLAAIKEEWAKAMENFKAGNVADALVSATAIKEKASQTMALLGLTAAASVPAEVKPEAAPAPAAAEPEKAPAKAEAAAGKGENLKWFQKALNDLGAEPKLAVDGRYGPATKRALMKFQTAAGLKSDGKASAETEAAMKQKLAGK